MNLFGTTRPRTPSRWPKNKEVWKPICDGARISAQAEEIERAKHQLGNVEPAHVPPRSKREDGTYTYTIEYQNALKFTI